MQPGDRCASIPASIPHVCENSSIIGRGMGYGLGDKKGSQVMRTIDGYARLSRLPKWVGAVGATSPLLAPTGFQVEVTGFDIRSHHLQPTLSYDRGSVLHY